MVDTLQLVKTVVADGNSATMDTGTLTGDLDVLRVVVEIEGGGSGGCRMRFNSDTGSNYRRLFSENGGSKDGHGDGANDNIANMVGRIGRRSYSINTIYNISGKESSGYGHCITDGGNTGSANAPTRMEYAFKWANTAQITSIQIVSDSTNWASGSTLNVYAYSRADEEISDEKTTLTNIPANTRYEEVDTRKIYRRQNSSSLGTPDLEISDASGWSTSGSGLSINSSGVITHTSSMSANARLEKSLGFTLGDTWTIDYEFTRTSSSGNNVRPLVVASSADNINDSGTDNDVLGQYGDTNFNAFKKVGTGAGAGLGWIAGDTTKRYMRMSRTSDTNFRLEVYTDSARTTRLNSNCAGYTDAEYNFNGCSVMNSVGNGMIDFPISAGTVTGLDTLISGNGSSVNGHSGTIENIKVYNNQVIQSNVSQKYGNPTGNADVDYGTYKQIRNLIPDDIITGVTLGIYNASADFKVAIFTESSNAPNTLLGTTTTKTGVSVSNTYTNYEITLDTPVTVPSDGKVWVCAYPSTTIKYAVRVDAGSDWYNSRYGGTSASYSSAFPSTMWASTGQGSYNPMFGVIIGEGQWKLRGSA